eukprot:s934_g35.t1
MPLAWPPYAAVFLRSFQPETSRARQINVDGQAGTLQLDGLTPNQVCASRAVEILTPCSGAASSKWGGSINRTNQIRQARPATMPPKAKDGARKRNSSRDRRGAAKAAAAAATSATASTGSVASVRRKSGPPAETGGSEPAAAASKEESKEEVEEVEVKEKAPPVVKMEKEQIKMVFTRFDLNGNGTIEVDELATVFQVLAPRQWSQKAIKRLFDGMDLDEDGKICFSEFIDPRICRWCPWEWIFDSGTNSFKGALEIAETTDGAKTLEWSIADCSEPIALPNLRSELAVIEGCNMEEEIKEIQPDELQKLETLMVVPDPIRRTLEAVYMLLLPSSGLPSINALTPPEWAGIQEMLKDSSTLQRVLNYRARKEERRERALL